MYGEKLGVRGSRSTTIGGGGRVQSTWSWAVRRTVEVLSPSRLNGGLVDLGTRAIYGLCLSLVGLGCQATVVAQVVVQQPREDLPVIRWLEPHGGAPGQRVIVTIHGERLNSLQHVFSDAPLKLVEINKATDKQAEVTLQIAADAASGIYPLYVGCREGLSNPRLWRVDELPLEVERPTQAGVAQPVQVPCTVQGRLQATDVDTYGFRVTSGQRLVFDLEAHRLGSPIRGVLTLETASGRRLAHVAVPSAGIEPDVRLAHTFEQGGDYRIRVRELTYQGEEFCVYSLRIGALQFAETMFPLGGVRGRDTTVRLAGGTLEQPLELNVALQDPAWTTRRLQFATSRGPLEAPRLFMAGGLAEQLEVEPNETPAAAQLLRIPVTVNGCIDRPGDRDRYAIDAPARRPLQLRVWAQCLGSALDPVVTIFDAQGRQVAANDDADQPELVPPIVRPQQAGVDRDVRFAFTPPAAGRYEVEVTDRFDHGGAAYAYRLQLGDSPPDFELYIQPGRVVDADANSRQGAQNQKTFVSFDGRGTGSLSLDRGGRGMLRVQAVRRGYTGPIRIEASGLPAGVVARPLVLTQNQGQLVLQAGFDAPAQACSIRVRGFAEDGSTQLIREARQIVVTSGLPQVASMHLWPAVAVGVSDQGAELALQLPPPDPLVPGAKWEADITVRRRAGIVGAVTIACNSLPAGIHLPAIQVPANADSARLRLELSSNLNPGPRTLELTARLDRGQSLAGMAKPSTPRGKNQGPQTEPLEAIAELLLEVQPLAELRVVEPQLEIAPGGTQRLVIQIVYNSDLETPISLKPVSLPEGISLGPVQAESRATRWELLIRAAPDIRPSVIRRLIVLRPELMLGDYKCELPTLRWALKVAKK